MKAYSSGLVAGGLALLVVAGVFTGFLPVLFIYAVSLIFAYGAAKEGKPSYLAPGFLLMGGVSLLVFGPSLALLETLLLAAHGLVLGISFSKRQRPEMIFIPSLVILFASMLVLMAFQSSLGGLGAVDQLLEVYQNQAGGQAMDAEMVKFAKQVISDYALAILFMAAMLVNLFICWIFSKFLEFRGLRKTGRFYFEFFRLRDLGLFRLFQLYLLTGIGSYISGMPLGVAMTSLTIMLFSLFFVQGLSLLVFSIKSRGRGKFRLAFMVSLSFFLPLVQLLLVFMGVLDQVKDFRKLEKLV